MTIIDLSKPIFDNPNDPGFMRIKIKHKPRWKGRILARVLGLPFKYSGTKEYWKRGVGMSREATLWVIEYGVTIMGIVTSGDGTFRFTFR